LEQLLKIELFGQPFTIKADSEVTKAREVADFLVKEVSKIEAQQRGTTSNLNKLAILILAALNIANENLELKKNHSDLLRNISERAKAIDRLLDSRLQ
jgi:cell division protein ZapA (FtsZ GTPase activity inhibitor)